jgi:gas vesicle protein
MANQENSTGPVLMAFVVGAIAGAAVALLYAPASGDETRRKLAERAREGRERAEDLAREGRDFLDRQRSNVTDAVERGREAFDQARKESL